MTRDFKLNNLWVISDKKGLVYPKIFMDKEEAERVSNRLDYPLVNSVFINEEESTGKILDLEDGIILV